MSRGIWVLVPALLAGPGADVAAQPAPAPANPLTATIENRTSTRITGVRFSQPNQAPAPAITLPIAPGLRGSFVRLPSEPCVTDAAILFAGAEPTYIRGWDRCAQPNFPVEAEDALYLRIVNRSDTGMANLRIVLPSAPWTAPITGNVPQLPGQSVWYFLTTRLLGCERDVRATYANNSTEIIWSLNVCETREIALRRPGHISVNVRNASSMAVLRLRSRVPQGVWTDNLIVGPIRPGATAVFDAAASGPAGATVQANCTREFAVAFADGQEVTTPPVDICETRVVSVSGSLPTPAPTPPPAASAPTRRVLVRNTWFNDLQSIYLTAPGEDGERCVASPRRDGCGPDLLGRDIILAGRSLEITPTGAECRRDLIAVWQDRSPKQKAVFPFRFTNVDVCAMREMQIEPPRGQSSYRSSGSGFLVNDQGWVVTNYHVVRFCNTVRVGRPGEAGRTLELHRIDPENDLAVLRGVGLPTSFLSLRPATERVRIGDPLVALGFPLGAKLGFQMMAVSGELVGERGDEGVENRFTMSALIKQGHSGGPILDSSGRLIGVNVAGFKDDPGVEFGITLRVLREFLRGANVPFVEAPPGPSLSRADMIERASPNVLSLLCYL